jgi:hypothetical protein
VYNKLFTKILDSSIWLESTPTRIVWLTMIAVMDEHGFAQFAAVRNVAHRARVTVKEAEDALHKLESPDPESSDPDNEGRRLERVPGGWLVLNAEKHRQLVTRAVIQAQTRERVRRHREKKRTSNAAVTPSEAEAEAKKKEPRARDARSEDGFERFWAMYPRRTAKAAAVKAWARLKPSSELVSTMLAALAWQVKQEQWTRDGGQFVPYPATWLHAGHWEDEPTAHRHTPDRRTEPAMSGRRCHHDPMCESFSTCTKRTLNEAREARGQPLL